MVTMTTSGYKDFELRDLIFEDLVFGSEYVRKKSLYAVDFELISHEFRGTGFKYSDSGRPIAGTVTSYAYSEFFGGAATIEGLHLALRDFHRVATTASTLDDKSLVRSFFTGKDTFNGGEQNDLFLGYGGDDRLIGNGSGDELRGGGGNDTLAGGMDTDWLIGGSGADRFVFVDADESFFEARDTIFDFSHNQGDKIDLSDMDGDVLLAGKQALKLISTASFHAEAGELRWEIMGDMTIVQADVDGDGQADFEIGLKKAPSLVGSDFVL